MPHRWQSPKATRAVRIAASLTRPKGVGEGCRVMPHHFQICRRGTVFFRQGAGIEGAANCHAGFIGDLFDETRVGNVFDEDRRNFVMSDLLD